MNNPGAAGRLLVATTIAGGVSGGIVSGIKLGAMIGGVFGLAGGPAVAVSVPIGIVVGAVFGVGLSVGMGYVMSRFSGNKQDEQVEKAALDSAKEKATHYGLISSILNAVKLGERSDVAQRANDANQSIPSTKIRQTILAEMRNQHISKSDQALFETTHRYVKSPFNGNIHGKALEGERKARKSFANQLDKEIKSYANNYAQAAMRMEAKNGTWLRRLVRWIKGPTDMDSNVTINQVDNGPADLSGKTIATQDAGNQPINSALEKVPPQEMDGQQAAQQALPLLQPRFNQSLFKNNSSKYGAFNFYHNPAIAEDNNANVYGQNQQAKRQHLRQLFNHLNTLDNNQLKSIAGEMDINPLDISEQDEIPRQHEFRA